MKRDIWLNRMIHLESSRQELLNEREHLISPYSRRCSELTSLELGCDTKSKRYVQLKNEIIPMHERLEEIRKEIKELEFQLISLMPFILSLTSEGGSCDE